jgi:hypothetical protein
LLLFIYLFIYSFIRSFIFEMGLSHFALVGLQLKIFSSASQVTEITDVHYSAGFCTVHYGTGV